MEARARLEANLHSVEEPPKKETQVPRTQPIVWCFLMGKEMDHMKKVRMLQGCLKYASCGKGGT